MHQITKEFHKVKQDVEDGETSPEKELYVHEYMSTTTEAPKRRNA